MKIKLNPDQEIVNTIREGLKRTGMTPKYFRNKIFKGSVVQQL